MKASPPASVRERKEIESLSKAGYTVSFVGWRRERGDVSLDAPPGCEAVTLLPFPIGYSNWKVGIGYVIWAVYAFLKVMVAEEDVIHAVDLESGLPSALAAILCGKALIYDVFDEFHLRHSFPAPIQRLLHRLDLWVMSVARAVIRVDELRISDDAARFEKKTVIVRNSPVDIGYPGPPNRDSRDIKIGLVGLLRQDRGVGWIFDAVTEVSDATFLAVGPARDDETLERLREGEDVDYRPPMEPDEALQAAQEADLLCAFYDPSIPIYQKASPNKLFDAMMLGRPIVVNEEIELSNLVEEADIGYAIPYGDTNALVELLRKVLSDDSELQEKGQNARGLFEKGYDWGTMEDRLLRVYQDATGGPR